MKPESRTKKSIRNLGYGALSQMSVMLLAFIVRSVFIKQLNIEYLGVNGLFTSILTVLSLAELGFGVVVVYTLYKPIADKNNYRAAAYLYYYSKIFNAIASIVAVLGILILPFLQHLVHGYEGSLWDLRFYYVLFLVESVVSYCVAYKRSIFQADQRAYVLSGAHCAFVILKSILQICILYIYANFYLFLIIQIFSTIAENFYISYRAKVDYPNIVKYKEARLKSSERKEIWSNVYAMVLSRICRVANRGAGNIVISSYVSVSTLGVYSNYILITSALTMIISQIFSAISGSLGNFIATESLQRQRELFSLLDFINFTFYAVSCVCFYTLVNPFISVWIGEEYLLDEATIITITALFLIEGLLQTLWIFRGTMGLFTQGKYRPVFAAVINLSLSLTLVHVMGLSGVILSSVIAYMLVNVWYDPLIILHYNLKVKITPYFLSYCYRGLCIILACCLTKYIFELVYTASSTANLIVSSAVTFIFVCSLFCCLNARSKEFRSLVNLCITGFKRSFFS